MSGPNGGTPSQSIFANDPALPVQMTPPKATAQQPERRLLLAVLEAAVDDIITTRITNDGVHPQKLRDAAVAWFTSQDRAWPCSFIRICEALGLAHEPIRRAVLAGVTLPARRHVAGEGNRAVVVA